MNIKTKCKSLATKQKMRMEKEEDILKYLSDRSIKQVDLMRKYNISRNTLKKYVYKIQNHNII